MDADGGVQIHGNALDDREHPSLLACRQAPRNASGEVSVNDMPANRLPWERTVPGRSCGGGPSLVGPAGGGGPQTVGRGRGARESACSLAAAPVVCHPAPWRQVTKRMEEADEDNSLRAQQEIYQMFDDRENPEDVPDTP